MNDIKHILDFACKEGIKFVYTGYNLIVSAPSEAVTQDFKETLKNHKNQLIAYIVKHYDCTNGQTPILKLSFDEQEFFEERAAILEYDGEMQRKTAEQQAFLCLTEYNQKKVLN